MLNRKAKKINYKRSCSSYKPNDMIHIETKIIMFGKGDKIWLPQ